MIAIRVCGCGRLLDPPWKFWPTTLVRVGRIRRLEPTPVTITTGLCAVCDPIDGEHPLFARGHAACDGTPIRARESLEDERATPIRAHQEARDEAPADRRSH